MLTRRRLVLVLALLTALYCTSWFKIMTWPSLRQDKGTQEIHDMNSDKSLTGRRKVTPKATQAAISYPPLYSQKEINPHSFSFLIANEDACAPVDNSSVFLVMLVKSGVGDVFDRQQIRRTWGGDTVVKDRRTITMFLLGTTTNRNTTASVQRENHEYSDIIQEDFVDSYRNLTIKNMMGLKWITMFCPSATYVASVDADVMLNVHNLVTRLEGNPRRQYAEGSLRTKATPVRDSEGPSKKWYTPKEVYPEATYAPFFPGSCYVMSGDVAVSIYRESVHVRYLPWDDVFVGLVMKRIGVTPVQGKGYERYPRTYESHALKWTLKRSIAVIIRHQKEKVDERLIQIWHMVADAYHHDKFGKNDVLFIFISVFGILLVYIFIVMTFIIKCKEDEADLDGYESDDSMI
ncbi:beta-1,3-galactosyltransferase 1-like [Acanthaster planci]|uniref:Hexosyltransferase n=1 Tax=Acanthaster planci TaxID=133434 RepID=A0A8B7Z5V0_ACAPL|nr:beta-1,3-galactosyltransferase 1-like [Acanthaster planci]